MDNKQIYYGSEGGATRRLMTVKAAAAELHCSISFVYKLIRLRRLTVEQRGRRKLILSTSIAEYRQRSIIAASDDGPDLGSRIDTPYVFKHLFQNKKKA